MGARSNFATLTVTGCGSAHRQAERSRRRPGGTWHISRLPAPWLPPPEFGELMTVKSPKTFGNPEPLGPAPVLAVVLPHHRRGCGPGSAAHRAWGPAPAPDSPAPGRARHRLGDGLTASMIPDSAQAI